MPKILNNKVWRATFATLLALASTSITSLIAPQASSACPSESQSIYWSPSGANAIPGQVYLVPSDSYSAPRYARSRYRAVPSGMSPRMARGMTRGMPGGMSGYKAPNIAVAPSIPQLEPFAQSGSDYLASIAEGGILRWDEDRLPLKVFISDGNGVPGYRSSFKQIVTRSFDEWASASKNKLSWKEVDNERQADVILTWTPKLDGPENSPEAGRTSTRVRMNRATGMGVIDFAHIQIQTLINRQQVADGEMWRIVLHEVGHAYGLQGHSPSNGDIMYRAVNPRQSPQLSSRDVATINRLYSGYPSHGDIAMQNN